MWGGLFWLRRGLLLGLYRCCCCICHRRYFYLSVRRLQWNRINRIMVCWLWPTYILYFVSAALWESIKTNQLRVGRFLCLLTTKYDLSKLCLALYFILFPLFMTIAICSLFCFCTYVAYIANNMDPDQTAALRTVWSGFICVIYVLCLSCFHICSLLPFGQLKGKGRPLGSCLWCLLWFCYFNIWYPRTGVVHDCIDSWSLLSFLLP